MTKFTTIILSACLLMAGCTKNFEEMNINPNEPEIIVDPGALLTNVIRGAVNSSFGNSYNRGMMLGDMNYNDFSGNYNNIVRLDAEGYYLWNYYDYIRDLNKTLELAEEKGLNNYKAVALVLRAWMFQNLTDMYGPVPFREAANARLEGIFQPKYEKQEVIYAGLLSDLEEASSLLGTTGENMVGDILFESNISRWKKFATGLTIRLLMRQSKQIDPTAALANILGNPAKYPLFTSNADQAALQYIADTRGNAMPLFGRSNSDYATSTRVTKNLVDYLKSIDDPRLPVYALPTQESVNSGSGPADFEYVGGVNATGPLPTPGAYSAPGMLWAPEQYNPTLASMNAAQGIILTYSEEQFNLAEAAEKGYIPGGSDAAEEYYLNAIGDQFAYYSGRVGDRYANSYLQLEAADVIPDNSYYTQPGVAYTGTQAEKLEKIAMQKWLSLYMVGFEAWFEWRRTGFPEIEIGPIGPGFIPRRVLYPADELRINEDNYREAVGWLGADDLKSRVWWDKE